MQTHDNQTGITIYTNDNFQFDTVYGLVDTVENGNSYRSVTQVRLNGELVGYVINHLTIVNITGHGRDYIHDQGKLHAVRETFGWTLAEPGTLLTKAGDWRSSCEQVVKAYLSSKAE